MFYRLFKLLTVTGLLFSAFTAKAGGRAEKTHVPGHIVKQHIHIEILAAEISPASVLVGEVPPAHFTSHPACVTGQLANLFSVPDGVRACNIVLRNSQIPRRILLMLFPFHVFW